MSIDQAASKTKSPGFRPGVCVKNGKLYAFSENRLIVMRGWPEMSAWTRTWHDPRWSRTRPKIDFQHGIIHAVRSRRRSEPETPMLPGADLNKRLQLFKEQKVVRDYFSNVPPDVRDAIAPFWRSQWHLHVMAARCPDSLDLIMSNPATAFCLASCWAFVQSPSRYGVRLMRRLIGSRRRHICGALGFPEAESSVSVLAKIPSAIY